VEELARAVREMELNLPEGSAQLTRPEGASWANNGVMERVFLALQREQIIYIKIEHASLDSTSIKAHPDAHGALKKEESSALESRAEDGTQKFMWLPRMTK